MTSLGRFRALDLVFELRAPSSFAAPLHAALAELQTDEPPTDRLTVRRTRRAGWKCRWTSEGRARRSDDERVVDEGEAFSDVLAAISGAAATSVSGHDAPVHGSAVAIGGAGCVFLGSAGSGTSALAAAAVQQGYRLLSDDLTVIDAGGRIRAFRRPIGLRAVEAQALEIDIPAGPFDPVVPFRVDSSALGDDRTPLRAVFLVHGGGEDRCGRIEPPDALVELYRHSVGAAGSERAMFARLERIARTVPVHLLGWHDPHTGIETVCAALR